ncbi:homeobox protein 5 isoform X2 [Contarinia nasturtii]|uniref:homeobox protein 5 isoform X2 n=1 Tax=Contarinia nasturtii TaxID=265458 RepID=UPI0012D393A6|nr:homeobox protein 5 isoform X2 [Contarinia nasturtii]
MAAASAGAIETGFLSGAIASSSSHLHQYHSEQQQQHGSNLIGSSFISQESNYVQRLDVEHFLNVKQQTLNNSSANVAPGWRRQLSEGEIIYFSPSGAALRKIEQIKDYLLQHGTCKCGLPCPLRPDYFFEFNPQVPNSPLQIPPEQASNQTSSCLHHTRLIEQHKQLTKSIHPTNFSNCLSSNQKLNINAVLNANSSSQTDGTSSAEAVFTSEQSDLPENQIENVTVSRTPPWRKNSILNHQQQLQSIAGQNVESNHISNANSRVPPLPQQHILKTHTQPPWQDESQKRRNNNSKKRPNFKEDPTGYLNHQTAILHSSILNVHSPELQDNESTDSTSQTIYHQSPMHTSRSSSRSSVDAVNAMGNQNMVISHDNDEQQQQQQQISVMQQQQQNQNVYIQQFDSNVISKNQMIIGSNGQTMRIIQNPYSNSNDFLSNSSDAASVKVNEFIGRKRTQNQLKPQTVQIPGKHQHHQSNPMMSQHQPQSQSKQFSSLGQYPKVVTTQQTIIMPQSDQETGGSSKNDNDNNGLPVDVTHLPNGVVQVHHNCDINELKSQPQTILVKSNQPTCNISKTKLFDHQYIQLPHKSNVLTPIVSVSQESPVSSSTANVSAIIEIQSNVNDRGPSQVGTISTSNESPPISSPDTLVTSDLPVSINNSQAENHLNKLQSSVYIAGQTSGKNTITSVVAGKAMTSTTTTNQFGLSHDKNRLQNDNGSTTTIQIHENRILRPAQAVHVSKAMNNVNYNTNVGVNNKNSNSRTIHAVMQENTSSSVSSHAHLPNIQVQQPANQIIMTSSGCQILVMPTQNNKNSNQLIIGQPTNASTLVVNNGSGQQNVVLNSQNTHMIGNEIVQGLNDNTIAGTTHSNLIQGTSNNVVIQSPNLIQPPNNVITANNTNSNFIVSSPNAIQPMIINNSGLLSHNGNVLHHTNQNVIQGNTSNILTTANANKVISNTASLLSPTNILTNQSNVIATNNQFIGSNNSTALLSPNNSGIVLNQLSNASYVIQPQSFTTVDGQVVNVINSDNGNQFVQQTHQRVILSPDSKRRIKKRKSTSTSPQSESPQQSPTIQTPSQQPTVLQITPQYHQSQSFQTTIEQQILLQNGQTILQPLNLIGQQLLVPASLMMTSDTVLQIQNVAPCGLITPQGIVQNKSFLSPNSANQQFIVSGNNQLSQVYGTPVGLNGLVVPQSNGPTFVQQSTTIVQQQTTMMNNNGSVNDTDLSSNIPQSVQSSPPDTTTHSPRSPERPESQRSVASDINMVQFVSSSEPDSVVSPVADSAQSPSSDYDRSNSYPIFKPNEMKVRRIQTPTLHCNNGNNYKMKADLHGAEN